MGEGKYENILWKETNPQIAFLITAAVTSTLAISSILYFKPYKPFLSDYWIIPLVLFIVASLFVLIAMQNRILLFDKKDNRIKLQYSLGPYKRDKLNIPVQHIKAITIDPRKRNIALRMNFWTYIPVMVLSNGKVIDISEPMDLDLQPANKVAARIAKIIGASFIPGQPKTC